MKMTLKIAALAFLLLGVASCEKHDLFDENTITGAVGPETYWTIESSAVKAGERMSFIGQYYSTVTDIDRSEVWYDLFMSEDKVVSCPLIKSFTYSFTSSTVNQQRVLQTIETYEHNDSLYVDSLRAFVLNASFPVSGTLAPVAWNKPQDTIDFTKNLNLYFGESFAKEFKDGLTKKMYDDVQAPLDSLKYGPNVDFLKGLSLLDSTVLKEMTDSMFDRNSNAWVKYFKRNDSIWSTTDIDTILIIDTIKTQINIGTNHDPIWRDTALYDTTYTYRPALDTIIYVYPEIKNTIETLWRDSVDLYDLIWSSEGYSIDYQRSYLIHAELRVYDEKGTYSRTDSKEIAIN